MRTLRLIALAVLTGLIVVVVAAAPALAGSNGSGWVDQDGGEIEVGAEGGTDGQDGNGVGGASSQPVCQWERVPEGSVTYQRWATTAEEFVLYYVDCPDQPRDIVEVPVGNGSGAPSAVAVRERAIERLVLPTPRVELNPSDPVVHVETWLRVDFAWETVAETASAGGVTATVTARPHNVVWDMGNGDQVICGGPGTRYDPSRPEAEQHTDCSYTYQHTSAGQPDDAFVVTATVTWELTWAVTGAPGGGSLPVATSSGSTVVQVSEMQALNQ